MLVWDYSPAETLEFVRGYNGRRRCQLQELSYLAYGHVILTNQAFAGKKGGKLPEVQDIFPFWTEDEVAELKLRRIAAMMKSKGGSHGRGETE